MSTARLQRSRNKCWHGFVEDPKTPAPLLSILWELLPHVAPLVNTLPKMFSRLWHLFLQWTAKSWRQTIPMMTKRSQRTRSPRLLPNVKLQLQTACSSSRPPTRKIAQSTTNCRLLTINPVVVIPLASLWTEEAKVFMWCNTTVKVKVLFCFFAPNETIQFFIMSYNLSTENALPKAQVVLNKQTKKQSNFILKAFKWLCLKLHLIE